MSGRAGLTHDTMPARRLLVTGGTGFVGSHTVAELVRRGHEVVVLTRRAAGVDVITIDSPLAEPLSSYGASKRDAEQLELGAAPAPTWAEGRQGRA